MTRLYLAESFNEWLVLIADRTGWIFLLDLLR